MKILILEDDEGKLAEVIGVLQGEGVKDYSVVSNFVDFVRETERAVFNLIIADLLVFRSHRDKTPDDMTDEIIDLIRDHRCKNFRTPVIALTAYEATAEEKFQDLNRKDITVVTYTKGSDAWVLSLRAKIKSCWPPEHFDFAIICALAKESAAFLEAGYQVGKPEVIAGLACRRIQIGDRRGVIVTASRMGLVSAAVAATQVLERFGCSLICMAGICGGVPGVAKMYDVVVPEICHQHDSGKWTDVGFELESYAIQLDNDVRLKIQNLVMQHGFLDRVGAGVQLRKKEFPAGVNEFAFRVLLGATSSGSAVVAAEEVVEEITDQHRKLHAFEMESFALYEAVRLSQLQPKCFSAKAVVDDGTSKKSDAYHRPACILSARVVYECIASGIFD